MRQLHYLALLSLVSLTACGGGSDGNTLADHPSTSSLANLERCTTQTALNVITTGSSLQFLTQAHYPASQSAAIIGKIDGQESQGYRFLWEQTLGPQLTLKSTHSPVLSFVPPESGSYQFSLTVSGNQLNLSESITLEVDAAMPATLNVRSDHQVTQGNGVSLRADRVNQDMVQNLAWCIASGPDMSVDVSNIERPLFTAPQVSTDTISTLRATASIEGQTVSDDVHLLITTEPAIDSRYFQDAVSRTFAYKPASPYANILQACVYSNQLSSSCSLDTLPLIGQEPSDTGLQTIMERVLVSHAWMGENFEHFLENLDPNSDFSRLLQSVTAIVISYDVRPSFYWVVTGAIYLDPNDLWLLAEERDTINETPDFRSGFGQELAFLMPWRYVRDNQYTSYLLPRSTRTSRTLVQMAPDLSSLLYHELAHANDFFPRSVHASLNGPTLLDDYNRRKADQSLISDQLSALYPLNSEELKSLAGVSFRGEAATQTQRAYNPADISHFFSQDRASDYYAFSTIREDLAMLFEEAMMSHRLAVLRDVGVTDSPDNPTGDTVIVEWGQRGRIGADALEARAAFVINQLMPELDGTSLVGALPEPVQMQKGLSWSQNLAISSAQAQQQRISPALSPAQTRVGALRLSGDRHRKPVE